MSEQIKQTYTFRNQYNTLLYRGEHVNAQDAWEAFWNECKYPEYARNIQQCNEQGIYWE